MNETVYAAQAEFLICVIGVLIPLLIWAIRDAEQRVAPIRTSLFKRFNDRR